MTSYRTVIHAGDDRLWPGNQLLTRLGHQAWDDALRRKVVRIAVLRCLAGPLQLAAAREVRDDLLANIPRGAGTAATRHACTARGRITSSTRTTRVGSHGRAAISIACGAASVLPWASRTSVARGTAIASVRLAAASSALPRIPGRLARGTATGLRCAPARGSTGGSARCAAGFRRTPARGSAGSSARCGAGLLPAGLGTMAVVAARGTHTEQREGNPRDRAQRRHEIRILRSLSRVYSRIGSRPSSHSEE